MKIVRVELTFSTLAERPDLYEAMQNMPTSWPGFMFWDPISSLYYDLAPQLFPEYLLIAEAEPGDVVAKAYSAPFVVPDGALPDGGWDFMVSRAVRGKVAGREPNAVSAVEISVRPDLQGKGLAGQVLAAMRDNAARLGFSELLAPVRPNGKKDPSQPFGEYAFSTRPDGLPFDPWLRVHVRAGGRLEKVAPRSMVIPGSLANWREWTDCPFDTSGPVIVPGALVPVMCDVDTDCAVYVEPNVWVRHQT